MNELEDLPLVTIGVASFNNARFIQETLDSISAQTYPNIEIIINDDCSTDNSLDIVEIWIKKNPTLNISLLKSTINRGLCASLNNILSVCKGEYIAFIASDDKYLPDFVNNRITHFTVAGDEVGICYAKSYLIDEVTSARIGLEERQSWPSGYIFEAICGLNGSFCKPFTSMAKRSVYEAIGSYDDTLLFEDVDFFLRAARQFRIDFLEVVDTEYRVVKGSLGSKVYSHSGLSSLSKTIHKNFGYSASTDNQLAWRLRNIAIKKLEIGDKTWLTDLRKSSTYTKNLSDKILVVLGSLGFNYNHIKFLRKR
jgi:glycosyltransferase involved in cell wall biosynthesis